MSVQGPSARICPLATWSFTLTIGFWLMLVFWFEHLNFVRL